MIMQLIMEMHRDEEQMFLTKLSQTCFGSLTIHFM